MVSTSIQNTIINGKLGLRHFQQWGATVTLCPYYGATAKGFRAMDYELHMLRRHTQNTVGQGTFIFGSLLAEK